MTTEASQDHAAIIAFATAVETEDTDMAQEAYETLLGYIVAQRTLAARPDALIQRGLPPEPSDEALQAAYEQSKQLSSHSNPKYILRDVLRAAYAVDALQSSTPGRGFPSNTEVSD